MKQLLAALLLSLAAPGILGAEASFKHLRSVWKAADEAITKREFEKAQELLEGAAEEAAALSKENSAQNSDALGFVLLDLRQPGEALRVIEEALQKLGPKPVAVKQQIWRGLLLSHKAIAQREAGQMDNALATAEEAKSTLEIVGGKYHPELYFLHGLIGDIQSQKKNYAEAEKAFRAALAQAESKQMATVTEWSGTDSVLRMYKGGESNEGALRMSTALGDLMMKQEKLKEAEEFYVKALKLAEQQYGKKHQAIVLPLEGMARVHLRTNRRREFESDVQRTYEVAVKGPGLEMWVANPLWLKLEVDLKEGNAAGVKQTAEKLAQLFAVQNYDTKALAMRATSVALKENKGDWARLEQVQGAFRDAADTKFAGDPARFGGVYLGFALATEKARPELAQANLEALVKTQENAKDKGLLMGAMGKLADLLIAQKKTEEALAVCQKITANLKEKYGDDSRVADAMGREASLMKELGREQEAAALQAKAQEVRKNAYLKR